MGTYSYSTVWVIVVSRASDVERTIVFISLDVVVGLKLIPCILVITIEITEDIDAIPMSMYAVLVTMTDTLFGLIARLNYVDKVGI